LRRRGGETADAVRPSMPVVCCRHPCARDLL